MSTASELKIYDVIIIGGGPAGYSAALYASRAGYEAVVVERLSAGGQMALTGDIDNYPGFEEGIDGFTLGMKMQQSAERFGAVTKYAEIRSVDFSGEVKRLYTQKEELLARNVIIASGANPRELGVDGEADYIGRGIHYCAHCDGRFYKDKTVAVIGGGNSAAADALAVVGGTGVDNLALFIAAIGTFHCRSPRKNHCSVIKNTKFFKVIIP